jgi:hypothetical protein
MTTLDLCWNLLSAIGNIPDEIILKIIYEFEGVKHPIVMMLLNDTRQESYMELYRTPFSKGLRKQYYKSGVNDDLLKIMNDNTDFRICRNYIERGDPGSFVPRQFGRLYYDILNDNLKVDNYSYKYTNSHHFSNFRSVFIRRDGIFFPIINNEPINGYERWEELNGFQV